MTINRKKFFDGIRQGPFPGKLNAKQVQGISAILDEWERRRLTDLRHLSNMLGTSYLETAMTMQPITEYGSQKYLRAKKYWPWIGRGLVQITWEANYIKFCARVLNQFGVDIVANPDAALRMDVAVFIMFEGMINGEFTGKKLSDYFNSKITDWLNARHIINRMDRAAYVAGWSKMFYADLVAAS